MENILLKNKKLTPIHTCVNRIEMRSSARSSISKLARNDGEVAVGSHNFFARFLASSLANIANLETLRTEKLSLEILWLAEKLKEQDGSQDAIWLCSKADALAFLPSADPPVQKGIVL